MNKKILFALSVCIIVLFGCKESPEELAIKQVTSTFFRAIQQNDSAVIVGTYPLYDKDYFKLICDTIQVDNINKSSNRYEAKVICYIDKNELKDKDKQFEIALFFELMADSSFVIVDSKKLFKEDLLPNYVFATGSLVEGIEYTDQETLEHLAIAHLIAKRQATTIAKTIEKSIKIQGGNTTRAFDQYFNFIEDDIASVILVNNTDYTCTDFTLTAEICSIWDGSRGGYATARFNSKSDELKPGVTKRYRIPVNCRKFKTSQYWKHYVQSVHITINSEALINQVVGEFDGSEFSQYQPDSILPQIPDVEWLKTYNKDR